MPFGQDDVVSLRATVDTFVDGLRGPLYPVLWELTRTSPPEPSAIDSAVVSLVEGRGSPANDSDEIHVGAPSGRRVRIESLGPCPGVGVLHPRGRLRFGVEGLTIVYGENGAGKTSFTRVLEHLTGEQALSHVTADATITLAATIDGESAELGRRPLDEALGTFPELLVLDDRRLHELCRTPLKLRDAPAPIAALKRFADAIDTARAASSSQADLWNQTCDRLTGRHPMLHQLEARVDASKDVDQQIDRLRFSRADRTRFVALRARASPRAAPDVVALERLESQQAATARLRTSLWLLAERISLAVAEAEVTSAEAGALTAGLQQVDSVGVAGFDSWRVLWNAVISTVDDLSWDGWPSSKSAACPVCQQELAPDARLRVERFVAAVESQLTREADAAWARLDAIAAEVTTAITAYRTLTRQAEPAAAPKDAADTNLMDPSVPRTSQGWADYAVELGTLGVAVQCQFERVVAALPAAREQALVAGSAPSALGETDAQELSVLRARAQLAEDGTLRDALIELLGARRRADAFSEVARGLTAKRAVSNEVRRLADAHVAKPVQDHLLAQLDRLDALRGRVSANLRARSGSAVISLDLIGAGTDASHRILSTGEQRALSCVIATSDARFGGGHLPPIFLDDPMTSLDEHHMAFLAETLADLATETQVVVFTHSVPFVMALGGEAQLRKEAGQALPVAYNTVRRDPDHAGSATQDRPGSARSVRERVASARRTYEKQLVPLASNNPAEYERCANDLARELRTLVEHLVEDHLLGGVVQRFQSRVQPGKLSNVKVTTGDAEKVNRLYKELHRFAHHRPLGAAAGAPSLQLAARWLDTMDELLHPAS